MASNCDLETNNNGLQDKQKSNKEGEEDDDLDLATKELERLVNKVSPFTVAMAVHISLYVGLLIQCAESIIAMTVAKQLLHTVRSNPDGLIAR